MSCFKVSSGVTLTLPRRCSRLEINSPYNVTHPCWMYMTQSPFSSYCLLRSFTEFNKSSFLLFIVWRSKRFGLIYNINLCTSLNYFAHFAVSSHYRKAAPFNNSFSFHNHGFWGFIYRFSLFSIKLAKRFYVTLLSTTL